MATANKSKIKSKNTTSKNDDKIKPESNENLTQKPESLTPEKSRKSAKPKKQKRMFSDPSFVLIYVISALLSFVLVYLFLWFAEIANINLEMENIYLQWLPISVFSLIVGFAISLGITKAITADSRKINEALNRVAKGDFNFKLPLPKNNIYKDVFESLNLMIDELNSIQILKQDFISNFSHEFKTPLSSVKGYAEYLLKSKNLTAEQKEYVQIIINESEKLNELSTNISLISKIENQKIVLDENAFSIDKQIREIIASLQPTLKDKQISVKIDLPKIQFVANEKLFKHAFTNILSNAIKFSFECSNINIYASIENNCVKIYVQDFGIGMSDTTKSHMFEKFYQANPQNSGNGLGLGLAITKKIIEHYNGHIEVESTLGKGTTMCVVVPKNI